MEEMPKKRFDDILGRTFDELKEQVEFLKETSKDLVNEVEREKSLKLSKRIHFISTVLNSTFHDAEEIKKLERNECTEMKERFNLNTLLHTVAEKFSSRIKIEIKADTSIAGIVILDKGKVIRVLLNLLKFLTITSRDRIIVLSCSYISGTYKFGLETETDEVSNSEKENIFSPYAIFEVEKVKKSDISGLSLTLAEMYVRFLGGEITSKRDRIKGKTEIEFKINGDKMSDMESTKSRLPEPGEGGDNKILVIEDDFATSRLLKSYLKKWGYAPNIVNTANQAFDAVRKDKYLAIILDIEIPNYNGLELLRELREMPQTKNTPVIVSSVKPEEQKAYMMGAVEYFVKPINYNFLVEVLTNYKLKHDSKILCVDDDVPTVNLVKGAIEQAGFIPIAESVSANVIDRIKGKEVDLAIIDLDMPHPNGFELIKQIKSLPEFEKLPIIIYTGKDNYAEDLKQIDGLFEDLLDKRSTNIEDLKGTIEQMIGRYDTPPPKEEVIEKEGPDKILLAEDYKHSQIIVTRLLKKNSFENIVVVENGQEALDMVNQEHFSLILMDMQMPIMNGFEATRRIRELPEYEDTPIIALTAFAMKGDREKCLEAGATDYIPKPIDSKEFIEKIKHYLNK